MEVFREIKGCKESTYNSITKERFCKLREEFCKFIKLCPKGYEKEFNNKCQNGTKVPHGGCFGCKESYLCE